MNDSDPPSALDPDQCVLAENVEFDDSTLGERRRGSVDIDITGSGLVGHTQIPFLARHLPNASETDAQLWAAGHTPSSSITLVYKDTSFHTVTPVDAITLGSSVYEIAGQSFHGKFFIAFDSTVDRLHVWDGTSLRRVGLAEPDNAPTGANAGSGSFIGTRYYRVRWTLQVGGSTTLRSEPSDVLTFAPSGSGASVTVTRPTTTGEDAGITHWELEASTDNANFYRIATTAIGTTTASDSTGYVSGYASGGFPLSADIGDYSVIPSARFLAVDQDRLVFAGSFEDEALGSRVGWTPVFGDPTGDGNDERTELDQDAFLDLDGLDGGALTGLSQPVDGYIYATKRSAIYKLVRTGNRSRAYQAVCLTKSRGALKGSLVEGVDQAGNPCLYALDPNVGAIRIGRNGVQSAGIDILTTWARVNINAETVVSRGVYYPETRQVHWWVAADDEDAPSLRIMLQTNETRDSDDGVRRGWTIHTIPEAWKVYSVCLFSDNIDDDTARNITLRPFIGTDDSTGLIQRCDSGNDDNGVAYVATIRTKPFNPVNILNRFGVQNAALVAKADPTAQVKVKIVRDYGVESIAKDVALAATGSEEHVIKAIDDLSSSSFRSLQIEFTDVTSPNGVWELNQFSAKLSKQETA